MRQYFEAEMRLLHEAAHAFSKTYPELAGQLNLLALRDRDPYVERLLEGFAYLTAQIRQRIDDDLPDFCAHLLTQFWPQILRPYPSAMIMQFKPKAGQLQHSYVLPSQTILKTPALGDDKIICQFRTAMPVKIQPLSISSVNTEISSTDNRVIKIHFESDGNINIAQLDLSDLCLYLHADDNVTLNLYYALTNQVENISINISHQHQQQIFKKGVIKIQASHLKLDDSMLPNCHRSYSGFSTLLDYFCFREKYFFVSLIGLEKIAWPPHTKQFSIEISCKKACFDDSPITEKNILLNCVPAINLFQTTSEPIHINHQRTEYPLIVDSSTDKGIQLFSIDSVNGIEIKSGKQYLYQALYDFKYRQNISRFYSFNYRDHGMEFLQPYLQIGGVQDAKSEILSCNITVFNGHYPRRYLQDNTIHQLVNVNSIFAIRNITRPTSIFIQPQQREWQWLVISHLSLNYHTLSDVTIFQRLLNSYCWSQREQHKRGINAVRQIDIKPSRVIRNGIMMQGCVLILTIDESGYSSIADIYLFGGVVHCFISSYVQFNHHVKLEIICIPSQRVLTWDMAAGCNPCI